MIYYKCAETHKKHIKYFQFLGEVGNFGGPVQKNYLLISKTKLSSINALKYQINTYNIFNLVISVLPILGLWKLLLKDQANALQA